MKNQYFGDINDYHKYGLLRALTGQGEIKTAVCWMLTADDGRSDGQRTAYLQQPDCWRGIDPELFDALARCLREPGNRGVREAETSGFLSSARFYAPLLSDHAPEREAYFRELYHIARGCDLIFFDPDNGLEVKSKPYGRRDSCKYLYWRELAEAYEAGYSVLVYQHFRREKREAFIAAQLARICAETGAAELMSYRTAHVVFLLIPQARHVELFRARNEVVTSRWGSQIGVGGLRV